MLRKNSITATPDLKDDRDQLHYVPAPCQVACPVGTDVPSYIAYIWEGKYEEAFEAITATNPLSSICGHVCDAPCEPKCRREDSDGAVAIRNLKRYVMEKLGEGHHLPPVAVSREESVGVVGGGPAGMAAAQDLAEAGFKVEIYEASDKLGGMAVWGIPRFRLPEGTIAQDVERLLAHCPGITVHYNSPLGSAITLDELKERHQAVVLTIGATYGKTVGVPGEDHENVIDGVGFLRRINGGERPSLPETVLVIGGGDVAMDACRAAKRMPGVKDVKVLYRRGPDEMPARRDELKGALAEEIEIVYNIQPTEVVTKQGGSIALRCVRTELGEPDEDGRRRPVVIAGSEEDVACGMVIAAVGQKAENTDLEEKGLMNWDRVESDWETMQTKEEGVFAAGDGAFGGSSIIEAIQHGHRVAYYVKAYINKQTDVLPYQTPMHTRNVLLAQDANWEINPREETEFLGLGDDPLAFNEVEVTYTDQQAKCEAARCFRCDVETASADYTVRTRESIFEMARVQEGDVAKNIELLKPKLGNRANPFEESQGGRLDELTFLPANLTRLVIDPYREDCKTALSLAGIEMDGPVALFGLDNAPDIIREGASALFAGRQGAYVGRKPLKNAGWIQLSDQGEIDPSADAVVLVNPDFNASVTKGGGKALGIRVVAQTAEEGVNYALDQGLDFLFLDGTGDCSLKGELNGAPELQLLKDVIAALRSRNAEETLQIIWFGGVRTGTDVAKLKAMGADAAVIGSAYAFALEGHPNKEKDDFLYPTSMTSEERKEVGVQLFKALDAEVSMMAKCTGKTSIHNLEPEDLRAVTIATSKATGIPLPGRNRQIG